MQDDFVIARNPDPASKLPYLIRLPLGRAGVVLKARDTWPRTAKIYCHRAEGWPADAEIVERVPTRACIRRGASIDLVLDRGRENRSQIVFTRIRGGREAIFWQSARTLKQARPNIDLPTRRASGQVLEIWVDKRERYPYGFRHQQATTQRRALPVGDYAVALDGQVVAAVERKSLDDLTGSLLSGTLRFQIAELAATPRAALVVEDRYSAVFKLSYAKPGVVADGLAELQVRWPEVPIMFAETRPLAEEWTFRFLGAALAERSLAAGTIDLEETLAAARPLARAEPTTAVVRAWALDAGWPVSDRGSLRAEVWEAYRDTHMTPLGLDVDRLTT